MMEEKNIPDIRFAGFADAWKHCKLGDIGSVVMCRRIFKHQTSASGEIPFFKIGTFGGEPDSFISRSLFEEYKAMYPYPEKGDILISASGSIGRTIEFAGGDEYFQDSNIVWLKHDESVINPFIRYLYEIVQWAGIEGSTIKRLYNNNILKTEVSLPSIYEQEKIANMFDCIDTLITLYQHKHDKLVNVKQSMLERMFPRDGRDVPEIRFAEFSRPWERRKLSSIYRNIRNAFVGTASPYYVPHGHFYLESNNVKNGQINRNSEVFINDKFYYMQRDKWLHTNDMVMVQSGHVGHAAVIPESLNNTAAHALIIFTDQIEEVEPHFLNYQYQTATSVKKIADITKGNTIKHILSSDMQNFVVDIPSIEEQQRIATYFRRLDNLISLYQHKLEKLKQLKQSMLQRMFV